MTDSVTVEQCDTRLTKREYFAIRLMPHFQKNHLSKQAAKSAVEAADALIAALAIGEHKP